MRIEWFSKISCCYNIWIFVNVSFTFYFYLFIYFVNITCITTFAYKETKASGARASYKNVLIPCLVFHTDVLYRKEIFIFIYLFFLGGGVMCKPEIQPFFSCRIVILLRILKYLKYIVNVSGKVQLMNVVLLISFEAGAVRC